MHIYKLNQIKHCLSRICLVSSLGVLSACSSWPEEGKGGWAEVYPPDHVMANETWYWQSEAVLWREYQQQKIVLDMMINHGLHNCLPGQMHQAQLKSNRINRELVAELFIDAEQDLKIWAHQLVSLQKMFNQVRQETNCASKMNVSSQLSYQLKTEVDGSNKPALVNPHSGQKSAVLNPMREWLKVLQQTSELEALLNSDNLFAFDSSDVTPKYQVRLAQAVELIKQLSLELNLLEISLTGYADDKGKSDYNIELGLKRAQAVKNFLHLAGINTEVLNVQIKTTSMGDFNLANELSQQYKIHPVANDAVRHSNRQVIAQVSISTESQLAFLKRFQVDELSSLTPEHSKIKDEYLELTKSENNQEKLNKPAEPKQVKYWQSLLNQVSYQTHESGVQHENH